MTFKSNIIIYGDYIDNSVTNYNIQSVGNFFANGQPSTDSANPEPHTNPEPLADPGNARPPIAPADPSLLLELSKVLDYFNGFDPQGTMKAIVERIMQIPDDSPQVGVKNFFLHSIKANAGTKIRRGDLQLAPLFKLAGFLSTKAPFSSSGPELVDKFPTTLRDPQSMRPNLKAYFRKGATQTPDPHMKQDEMDFYDWISKQL